MGTVLGIVLPVFGVILAGYLVARTPLFDEAAVRGLSNFVFWVAIPALLFRTLARGAVEQGADLSIAYAYFLACGILFLIALAMGRLALRRDGAEAALLAMGAVFSNTVMLGIPLVLTAFGEEGVAAIMLIIAFHSTILIPMATIAVELARGSTGGGGLVAILRKTLVSLIRNPVVVAMAAGLAWSLADLPMPGLLDRFLDLLGRGAVPCAL
ncbi:MAG: AEC family transporter, partial [Rhodospirillaceae bacterium]|nr:AEC family transporter [Rhodospirillaceae bacterium]